MSKGNSMEFVLFVKQTKEGKTSIHQVLAESCTQGTSSINGDIIVVFNLGKRIDALDNGYEIEEQSK